MSRSLKEVWDWKEAVYNDIGKKSFTEKKKYYKLGLLQAAQILKCKLVKNEDGSYYFI